MKDGDLREARRCLANEETGKAIELYEAMRKRGEHEAEADLAVKICKYYDACKSGAKDDISASEADLVFALADIDEVDTEFALAFPPLVAKALTLKDTIPAKFLPVEPSEPKTLSNGVIVYEFDYMKPTGLMDDQGRELFSCIPKYRARFHIAEISRKIFLAALASDEFAMLNGDAKRRLELAAAELDGHFVFWCGRDDDIPPYNKQMSDIYRRLGRRDARKKKSRRTVIFVLGYFAFWVILAACFWLFMNYSIYHTFFPKF